MELLSGIFAAFGLSASAGLNAYIPLLVIGIIAHYTDLIHLNSPWDTLANPWILILLGVLVCIEMLVDKIPAVNHINDLIQTIVRPLAGAIAFAAGANVISGIHPVFALACGILIAGSVHTVKSAIIRPAVTTTTAGLGNIPVSLAEDVVATFTSILAVILPFALGAFVLVMLIGFQAWRRKRAKKQQLN
jgi:large-conductance mechanosensitive channel